MTTLSIDIETYSSVDIKKAGAYAYVDSPDFEVLLFAYAWDDEPVQLIDLLDFEEVPEDVVSALTDPDIIKTAFNANFERTCLAKHINSPMPPEQWRCTAVHALTLGLPGQLKDVAKALKLEQQKDTSGKNLIRYFSIPCKPTKVNGGRTRNMPWHEPEKWEQYKAYCIQDVVTEREVRYKLEKHPIAEFEQKLWELDQRINDQGVNVDTQLVDHAITCDEQYKNKLTIEAAKLTGLDNPNSLPQLKGWLNDRGLEVDGLTKDTIPELIEQTPSDVVRRALELRQELSKTSVRKYEAMRRGRCKDSRVRGILQFYGANRTGRWAGRLVQVHNLPKNTMSDLEIARDLLRSGDYEMLEILFDRVLNVLSQLIRTAFIPSEGRRFIVSDFSAIEARVIAWLAGEKWRMDVFNTHGKIYEASASTMFKVPLERIVKGNPEYDELRPKGKVAELALGYQGGPPALIKMGALDMGIPEEDLRPLVDAWRSANPAIKKFWYDVGNATIDAVGDKRIVKLQHGLTFIPDKDYLFIQLPSGRKLAYYKPILKPDPKYGRLQMSYEGVDQDTKKWGRLRTYGGKLVENIVQAVARDCLAESLIRLDAAGFNTAMHVHDETVIDEPIEFDSLDEVVNIMGQPIEWAPGLPLKADAFETEFYMKD
jgi:DNA polymerase